MTLTSLKFLSSMIQLLITYSLYKTHLNSWKAWNWALQDSLAFPLRDLLGTAWCYKSSSAFTLWSCCHVALLWGDLCSIRGMEGSRQMCKISVKSGNMCSNPAAASGGALKRCSWKKY